MGNTQLGEYTPDYVSPPGETLLEMLDERGLTQADLAQRLGRPKKTINEIIKGKASITPETALQLELAFGTPASFWLSREQRFQEWLCRVEQQRQLSRQVQWVKQFPYAAMVQLGWLPSTKSQDMRLKELLRFFQISSPKQWSSVLGTLETQFRQSNAFEIDPNAVAAWLRKGELVARSKTSNPYNRGQFLQTLSEVRSFTLSPVVEIAEQLDAVCSLAGVNVVLVPELPKCRVSGATRWLGPKNALIQLSLRYKTDDHFWFSFFHEAGHVVLHSKNMVFLENTKKSGNLEMEANQFACDILIPRREYQTLATQRQFSRTFVTSFAKRIGLAPGIVVGMLQHDGFLPRTHLNSLKQRVEFPT